MFVAAVIVVTAALGVGVRTAYGPGIDPALGSQIVRDFLADQGAVAAALSKADQTLLANRLSDNALTEVIQQIHDASRSGSPPTVTFQPSSISVSRAQDPNDLSLLIEVQEDGTKTVITSSGPNAAPKQEEISFHGDFWLRLVSGRYVIADQSIQTQPASNLPSIAIMAAGLLWVALASILYRRTRTKTALQPVPPTRPLAIPSVSLRTALPVAEEDQGPPAKVVIRTFGGLQVLQDGKDWAPALSARPVTGFVWRRLLVAKINDASARPTREEIGREASPGLDRETQLRRLRNLIYQGLRELPEALRDRIAIEPQVLTFNLDDCEVDAISLLTVSAESVGRSLLSPSQLGRAQHALDASSGVFLPEFESVEDLATDHHSTCTQMVGELRERLGAKRLDLAILLAATHLADGRVDRAIAILEASRREHAGRRDIAERLAAAYRAAGRDADARGLAELKG